MTRPSIWSMLAWVSRGQLGRVLDVDVGVVRQRRRDRRADLGRVGALGVADQDRLSSCEVTLAAKSDRETTYCRPDQRVALEGRGHAPA